MWKDLPTLMSSFAWSLCPSLFHSTQGVQVNVLRLSVLSTINSIVPMISRLFSQLQQYQTRPFPKPSSPDLA